MLNLSTRKEDLPMTEKRRWGRYTIFALLVGGIGTASVIFLKEVASSFLETLGTLGYLGVFLGALAANASIIFPVFPPIFIPFAISFASQADPYLVSILYAVGASFGEGISYIWGKGGKALLDHKDRKDRWIYTKMEGWLNRHGKWAIFILAFQPILPFDVLGIVAGFINYSWKKLLIFCFLGRVPKYLILIAGGGWGIQQLFS